MVLHELRVKRVPIYTRLNSFANILKKRPIKEFEYEERNKKNA